MSGRARITRLFVWIMVLAMGPLVGAKLFDLLVLVGAWSASPPASLELLPYGDAWPVDTGEFFIPGSAAALLASLAAAVSGWKTPWSYRALLMTPLVIIVATLVLTVGFFWPVNAALWRAAQQAPGAIGDADDIAAMVRSWVALDWVRVGLAFVGFAAAARALSLPYPAERTAADPPVVRAAFVAGALAVAAFIVWFLIRGLA